MASDAVWREEAEHHPDDDHAMEGRIDAILGTSP
jgi:hypothetical protein